MHYSAVLLDIYAIMLGALLSSMRQADLARLVPDIDACQSVQSVFPAAPGLSTMFGLIGAFHGKGT